MNDVMDNFFTLGLADDLKEVVVDKIIGVKSSWKLGKGARMSELFPPEVEVTLKKDRGDLLTDFLNNNKKVVLLSEQARSLFEETIGDPEAVEYLPFTLKNKKGRIVKEPRYYLANPLIKLDCMDRELSDFITHDDGIEVATVNKLRIISNKVPDNILFFRLGEHPLYIIYRSQLVNKIKAAGLTGLNLTPMGEQIW